MDRIVSSIKSAFTNNRWTWKIDGQDKEPTRQDIKDALTNALEALDRSEQSSYIETGRILIKKDGTHRDVYLLIGDMTDE